MNEPTNIIDLAAALQERLSAGQKAAAMWAGFTPNERAAVRLGIFPAGKMHDAAREGYDHHALVVALMNIAARARV